MEEAKEEGPSDEDEIEKGLTEAEQGGEDENE
jgi:hypothetical protein